MIDPAFTFEHPAAGIVAAGALLIAAAVVARRRLAVPRSALVLAGIGALLLTFAAAGLTWQRPSARPVVVGVDLSPSTRGAAYRDPADLRRRARELLGHTPYELRFFAEQPGPGNLANDSPLPDLPASRTVFPDPAGAPAVILFSDGRLTSPGDLPPVFCVIDPRLEQTDDAAVTSLDVKGDSITVGVRNMARSPRPLVLSGVAERSETVAINPGGFVLTRQLPPTVATISATFAPGDAWPENDSLRVFAPPPPASQRWWVGGPGPDDTWRSLAPENLPDDPAQYLTASVVVLENVNADALDDARRSALQRYVRDLGGGLVILGGDRAFAAGEYPGTALDALSPLACTPPEPTTRWILLADASGSMNQPADAGGRTRWQYAADALAVAAGQLPAADVLDVGSFSGDLRWWSRGRSVTETVALPLPPADVHPRGKTNLDAALRQIVADADAKLRAHLLIATDAQATVERPAELAADFKSRRFHVHVLLIGETNDATALPALRTIASETGGSFREERLPEHWAAGLGELLRAARDDHVRREPVTVRFSRELADVAPVDARVWNHTWLKASATPLAEAEVGAARLTMAARWNVGEGRVVAAGFAARGALAESLARLVERQPRDPRFAVSWETDEPLRVTIDAMDGSAYLNGERLTLEIRDAGGERAIEQDIPQTEPGRYALATDAPRRPSFARIQRGEQTLDTIALAGRYAREFNAVGNDRSALADLAHRTGGTVVEPGVTRRLNLPRPRRAVPLATFLAIAGAALIAAGLVRWRIGS